MDHKSGFGALILAAGMSSRMGDFKPLLPIGSSTLIERQIKTFKQAGIEEIIVVTGNQGDRLKENLVSLSMTDKLYFVENDNYQNNQMFDSVTIGLKKVMERKWKAVFIIPADIPLFQCFTVKGMMDSLLSKPDLKVIKPVYNGHGGHPLLINSRSITEIINYHGDGGLKGALGSTVPRQEMLEIDFCDSGILLDADTKEDYKKLFSYEKSRRKLSIRDCQEIQDYFKMSEKVKKHCQRVSEVATRIGKQLIERGITLDLILIRNASLLHDIAKGNKKHEQLGGQWLRDMDLPELAEVVEEHNELLSPDNTISEKTLLYLADKSVIEDQEVTIEERFHSALEKFGEDKNIKQNIIDRKNVALLVRNRIQNIIE